MTATRTDREEFFACLAAEFGDTPAVRDTARKLLRTAATVQRYAEEACNRELTKREERLAELADKRAVCLAEQLGCRATVNGDPRGYVVKLQLPSGRYNTWGGREAGWGVPS